MSLEDELYRMLEESFLNIGMHRYIESLQILFEPAFYFEVFMHIFPQLQIKMIKIQQYEGLTEGQKLQELIDLIGRQLSFDLSKIKGQQIVKQQAIHIYELVSVLYECSKLYIEKSKIKGFGKRSVSHPDLSANLSGQRNIQSAQDSRQKLQDNQENHDKNHMPNGQVRQFPASMNSGKFKAHKQKSRKKKKHTYSSELKRQRSATAQKKNLYESVTDILINQKNQTIRAAQRDKRKNKNKDIIEAKYKYHNYLKNYTKDNRVVRNLLGKQKQPKSVRWELPLSDFQNIDNFFKSFNYKLRDQKAAYLRRIEKLIRKQQIDRMCYKNKLERDLQSHAEKAMQTEVNAAKHQHDVRIKLIKQQGKNNQENIMIAKKAYEEKMREQIKQLKQTKKKDLKMIENYIKQENEKVLMGMEVGGKLQNMIMELYKRF